jgi:hypothetical protein
VRLTTIHISMVLWLLSGELAAAGAGAPRTMRLDYYHTGNTAQ